MLEGAAKRDGLDADGLKGLVFPADSFANVVGLAVEQMREGGVAIGRAERRVAGLIADRVFEDASCTIEPTGGRGGGVRFNQEASPSALGLES
jgi:hypothetical protein